MAYVPTERSLKIWSVSDQLPGQTLQMFGSALSALRRFSRDADVRNEVAENVQKRTE